MVEFKVKNNARAGNTVTLQVEVEQAAVHSEREHVVENASRRVSIPGFRKGKAPKDLILKQLDPGAILEQTLENLAKKLYPEVVRETAIRPVDTPQLEVEEITDSGPVKIKFSVTVYPEVKLGRYKGLKADKSTADVKPEEVDRVIREFQESFASVEPIADRVSKKGDILEFTMETTTAEKKVTALSGKGIRLTIGESRLPAEFDDGLVGLQIGSEKQITYTCPADFWLPELAGKAVQAKVNVSGLFRKKLPDVTDEFCKTYFRADSVAQARADIAKRLGESKERNADAQCREELVRQVVAEMQVDLPDVLVEQELDTMLREMDHDLQRDKMDLETYLKRSRKTPDDIRKELRDTAVSRVKSKLALRAIGESEKIAPTAEEIQKELEQVAATEGKDVASFMNEVGSNAQLFVEDYLKRRQALDFVVSKAKIQIRKEEVAA